MFSAALEGMTETTKLKKRRQNKETVSLVNIGLKAIVNPAKLKLELSPVGCTYNSIKLGKSYK